MTAASTIRLEAEAILALTSGPWSKGENLPPELAEAMIVRSEWLRKHAQAILDALGDDVTVAYSLHHPDDSTLTVEYALRTLRDQNHQRIAALLEWLAEEYEAVIRQQEREVRANG